MDEFKHMSNNELILTLKELEQEHISVKEQFIKVYDKWDGKLSSIEKRYAKAVEELNKRKNGK